MAAAAAAAAWLAAAAPPTGDWAFANWEMESPEVDWRPRDSMPSLSMRLVRGRGRGRGRG